MNGYRLAALRKAKGLSQQDIADFLQVSRPAYTQWETGRRRPEGETLVRIADFFDVSVDYLEGRDEASNITDPEWIELFELIKAKGTENEAITLLRSASRLSKNQLRDILKVFSMIEAQGDNTD